MSTPVSSCYDIESAIKNVFVGDDSVPFRLKAIDVSKNLTTITRPSFSVAVLSGTFGDSNATGVVEENAEVVVTLVVTNVANEEERRRVIHPLTSWIVSKLHRNDLGLDIAPLTVKGWNDVSQMEHSALSITIFEIKFSTSFTVHPESAEQNYRQLLSIGSSFKSETPEHEVMLQGEVIFNEVNNEQL